MSKKPAADALSTLPEAVQERLRARFEWVKVDAPKVWRPTPDQELIGFYGGYTKKNGSFGPYDVVLVHVPRYGSFTVSGTQLIQLVDAAVLQKGDPVRIIYRGTKDLDGDKRVKLFELLVASDDEVDAANSKAKLKKGKKTH